jgi:DNA-binding NtrC family response regulator
VVAPAPDRHYRFSHGSRMDSILLVEDKDELREMLTHALKRMGYAVTPTAQLADALKALEREHFSAVLTDLKLPSGTGMDVLRAALEADSATPVIVMTAYGSIQDAVAAMRDGAYDFIQKPIDLEHLKHLLARAIERQQLLRENLVLKEEYAQRYGFPRMVGEHPAMLAAAREMQRIAAADTTVLLLGESGTGKELFARAIHQLSARGNKPFVALNCAAIPETLVENELFGHERGAFTGANARKLGKFEMAEGGTIFLDEIGELPLEIQGKLLRVLEQRTLERLGGTSSITVDVRVITATNRDLEAAAEAGEFRRDLYYRLAVFPIRIPSLRERGDDVELLAEHFLERFRRELRKPRLALASDAIAALRRHPWPGNVRELQNVMERAAILNDAEIHAAELGLTGQNGAEEKKAERARIESTLRACKWNKNDAAQKLGISYRTLLSKIHAYELD